MMFIHFCNCQVYYNLSKYVVLFQSSIGSRNMSAEIFRMINGLYLGKHFPDDAVLSALAYKPPPGDLIIVGYPKCGTTWMQHIVYNILMDAEEPEDPLDQVLRMPFLEMQGAEAAMYAPQPRALKTHLPFHLIPYSRNAKYICIMRNPYDCCVSLYYHTRNNPPYNFSEGTFEEFFELFLDGRVEFGDYFDNVLSWYKHRKDPNVLFLTYEELKADTARHVLRIAAFIGEERQTRLKENPELLRKILEKCSVEYMKQSISGSRRAPRPDYSNSPQMKTLRPELLKGLNNLMEFTKKPMTGSFVRNGKVGDWRNHFSPEQIQRMKQRIAEATVKSDFMNLWRDVDIPFYGSAIPIMRYENAVYEKELCDELCRIEAHEAVV
ncbi:sulfotransferase 1C4-like [Dermacentor andersoni]|uniref:sulfotransferase 1C4-like n=1 Tax=Dermacentor andersoni TaxID=34620 RepID=UPI003B3B2498